MINIQGPLTVWLDSNVSVVKGVFIESGEDRDLTCHGCILTHSLVNAHTHLPMVLLRGLVTEKNFWDWLKEVEELETLMGRKETRAGYYLGIWENLLEGNTLIYSMYRDYQLVENTFGVELHLGPISHREGGRDVESLLERFEKRAPPGVVPTLFAHSLYRLPLPRLKEISEILRTRVIEFQIHTSETKEEVLRVKKTFGQYPVRVMEALGLLTPRTMLVHGGWLTKGELDVVASHGPSLVHVPASNARLAIHGFFPWKEAEERGIKVLIGTDSPASNDGQSVLQDLRLALLSAKDRYWDAEPFGRKSVKGVFDKKGFALWKSKTPQRLFGEPAVISLLYNPSAFSLVLLVRNGEILFPRPVPREVSRSVRVAQRFLERVNPI